MQSINPLTKQPYKILFFGDGVVPSGFGRIVNNTALRLHQRGYGIQVASISYSGWPHGFPFHVWPLAGQDIWTGLVNIVNATQPDILVSVQDFPYHQTIWNACRIDFSKIKWVFITPIDGVPVHPDWVKLCDYPDGKMVISRFGIEALRQEGKRADLCHPGVDVTEFYPAEAEEKIALRKSAGYEDGDFIVGVMCMNQGRKAISSMIEAFYEFAKDKPEAKLYLDMDKASPAGWDIPNLLKSLKWTEAEQKRVKYRENLQALPDGKPNEAMQSLRNRYAILDLHMVISHREGYGLPLHESMACKVATMALDYCSGTEILGEGRGYLVNRLPYMELGTWGGARDGFPDMNDFHHQLELVYGMPAQRQQRAQAGYEWAIKQTWDVTADQVEATIQAALKRNRKDKPIQDVSFTIPTPGGGLNDHAGRNGNVPNLSSPPANPLGDHSQLQQLVEPAAVPDLTPANGADGGQGGQA